MLLPAFLQTHVFLILHPIGSTPSGERKGLRFHQSESDNEARGGNRHIRHNRHTRQGLRPTIRQTTRVTQKVLPRVPTSLHRFVLSFLTFSLPQFADLFSGLLVHLLLSSLPSTSTAQEFIFMHAPLYSLTTPPPS